MPATDAETPQFLLKALGPKGEHAFIGAHRVRFYGTTTGAVSPTMSLGVPGVTATKVAAGIYRLAHPPVSTGIVDVWLSISQPSGVGAEYAVRTVTEQNQVGTTGTIDFRVLQGAAHVNPPTGTTVQALFFVAPIRPY